MKPTIVRALLGALLSMTLSSAIAQVPMAQKSTAKPRPVLKTPDGGTMKVTLPRVTGKVSRLVSGKQLVAGVPGAFIADGNKRSSLCYPNKSNKITCTPLVAKSVMKDIDVFYFEADKVPLILFSTSPTTTRSPGAIARAQAMFMARLRKQSKTLVHHAVLHADDVPMPPSMVQAGDSCGYDDEDGMSCTGGGGGGGGSEGEGGGGYDCWECDYPTGNDNGDPAPGESTDEEGGTAGGNEPNPGTPDPNNPCVTLVDTPALRAGTSALRAGPPAHVGVLCPIVVIPGTRPGPIPPIGTIPAPGTIPPIERLPSGPSPWLPSIDWCRLIGLGCGPIANEGQRIPGDSPEARRARQKQQCVAQAPAAKEYCTNMAQHQSEELSVQCVDNAIAEFNECIALANGQQP
jgi:hypothetical protein